MASSEGRQAKPKISAMIAAFAALAGMGVAALINHLENKGGRDMWSKQTNAVVH